MRVEKDESEDTCKVKLEELVFLLFYSIKCIFKEQQGHSINIYYKIRCLN